MTDARAAGFATAAATVMIAQQVVGKATRDTLFLGAFDVADLPAMIVGAAVTSLLFVLVSVRLIARFGPARVVPWAFAVSAVVLTGLAALARVAPAVTAVLLYLHVAAFGAILVSGFWSTINERFDAREARRRVGWITAGGAFGGLLGGLVAEGAGALLPVTGLLPVLAVMHILCGLLASRVGTSPLGTSKEAANPPTDAERDGASRYLRDLAALVVLGALGAVFLDYVLKARAVAAFPVERDMLRFFALFYTGVSATTFVLQVGLAQRALARLGLANTVATHAAGIACGAGLGLIAPGLASAATARGLESSLRGSLFRSGYEPLYVPLLPSVKRRTKQWIDVGSERLGDALGAAVIAGVLLLASSVALVVLSLLALVAGLVGVWLTRRIHRGWLAALEADLEHRAEAIDVTAHDLGTRTVVLQSIASLRSKPRRTADPDPKPPAAPDATTQGILTLRGHDATAMRDLLVRTPHPPDAWVAHVIPLLARDDLADVARHALRAVAVRHVGALVDRLVDPDADFTIRRRVPTVLAGVTDPRAVAGLLRGLEDRRFEVRYRCARALLSIRRGDGSAAIAESAVHAAVRRELALDERIRAGHRLLDPRDDGLTASLDEQAARLRADLGLELVFTLLALVLPAKPLRLAYRGVITQDPSLRGVALEYLESVVPVAIRDLLWPRLTHERPTAPAPRDPERTTTRLMESTASIDARIAALASREDRDGR